MSGASGRVWLLTHRPGARAESSTADEVTSAVPYTRPSAKKSPSEGLMLPGGVAASYLFRSNPPPGHGVSHVGTVPTFGMG